MEVFIFNTQLYSPLVYFLIDCKSLHKKVEAAGITEPLPGKQLSQSLVPVYFGLWRMK